MSKPAPPLPANAVVVPGPSLRSEGLGRGVKSTIVAATELLAGAADMIHSLAR